MGPEPVIGYNKIPDSLQSGPMDGKPIPVLLEKKKIMLTHIPCEKPVYSNQHDGSTLQAAEMRQGLK